MVEVDTRPLFFIPKQKVEAICEDSNGKWVLGLDNEEINVKVPGEEGGLICDTDRNCVPLNVEPEKRKEYGISGIAILDN